MNKIKEVWQRFFKIENITKIVLAYILFQPFLDILSFLDIRNMIPIGISTYLKPLFVFGLGILIYFTDKEQRKKWTWVYLLYGILIVVHLYLLYNLNTKIDVILHEFRFMINMAYMVVFCMICYYLYSKNEDKKTFISNLKKVLISTFIIYAGIVIVSILTGTSGKTYEYSDALKQGFKGWFDSGQILGHAMAVILPFLIYYLLNFKNDNKKKQWLVRATLLLPIIVLCLIGTKVTYFMCGIVVVSHVILYTIFYFREKQKTHLINAGITLLIFIVIVLYYKISPVSVNVKINNDVLASAITQEKIDRDVERKDLEDLKSYLDTIDKSDTKYNSIYEYYQLDVKASKILGDSYKSGAVHPSDNRKKQLVYNYNKFMLSGMKYKMFGLGYLNQPNELQMERDILMVVVSFGFVGIITVLLIPIALLIYGGWKFLRNIRKLSLETLFLFEGFIAFFGISAYAGYTFIYTNFSIFLVVLMTLIFHELKQLDKKD